jgi:hypothetical protein
MDTFKKGETVRLELEIKNDAGSFVDPSTGPVVKYKTPSGTTTTKTYPSDTEVVRVETGSYYILVTASESGTWAFQYSGSGTNAGADEGKFKVEPSEF